MAAARRFGGVFCRAGWGSNCNSRCASLGGSTGIGYITRQMAVVILSRWIHVVTACLAIGGVFFMRFILPYGLTDLQDEVRIGVLLKTRRAFKILIHTSILFFV